MRRRKQNDLRYRRRARHARSWRRGYSKSLMYEFLNKRFRLAEANTTIRTEVLAGITTFMTMSYIIFVQPAVLSTTGMDFQAVVAATCIISAIGCFLMA